MKKSNELAGPGSFAVLFDHKGIRIGHTYSEDIVFHPGGRLDPATVNALVAEARFGEKTRQLLEDVREFPEQFGRALAKSPDPGMFQGFAPVNQKWNYGVARRFETVPWTIFYMIPEQSLNAQIAQMTRRKTVFAAVISLIALLAGIVFAAVIRKPIGSLSTATQLIAGGDLAARARAGHKDELGRLGKNFNSMAERIQAQATALQKARDELELRVQERTAALRLTTKDLELEITERKQSEEALRESSERLRLAQQVARVGTFEWNIQSGLNQWTPEIEAMYGLPPGGFAGTQQTWENLVHPEDRAEAVRRVSVAMESGNFEGEWRVIWPDGTVHWLAWRAVVFKDESGKPLRLIGVNINITDRKQAEEKILRLNTELEERVIERTAQLQAANKELEAFSYSVSHDLRVPLRAIDGFSLALLEDCADKLDAVGKGYLEQVRGASQEMGQLIDALLQLARVTRSEMRREVINLSQLAEAVVSELRRREPERALAIKIEDGLSAQGDKRLLQVVLNNLLGNAWKFTSKRERSEITVGKEHNDHEAFYFVRDNGAGFDMAYASKLFGAFQRLHGTSEFEGTGIGLATVQRIVHRHGGRVWAEGAVDRGATFYFTLPDLKEMKHGEQSDLSG